MIKNFNLSWWLVRLSPILLLPAVFFDIEVLFLVWSVMLIHIKFGIESIINDYIHDYETQITYVLSIRLLILQILLYFVEFTF